MKKAQAIADACDGAPFHVGIAMLRAGLEAMRAAGELYSAKVVSTAGGKVLVELLEKPGGKTTEVTCELSDAPKPPAPKYPAKAAKGGKGGKPVKPVDPPNDQNPPPALG